MTSPGEGTVSGASPSRQRGRKTKAETAAFNDAIWEICAINQPLSARQCYYRAVVAGLVDKDTAGSRKNEQMIGHALEVMRERGVAQYDFDTPPPMEEPWVLRSMGIIPFEWITDNTRTRFQADLHDTRPTRWRTWPGTTGGTCGAASPGTSRCGASPTRSAAC